MAKVTKRAGGRHRPDGVNTPWQLRRGPGKTELVMPDHTPRRRKPVLSGHQKQIRFLTRLSVVMCSLFTLALFWLVNRTSYLTH